jgi:hypothetical protein
MDNNIIQLLIKGNYSFDPVLNLNIEKYLPKMNNINLLYGLDSYSGKIYDNYKNILIDFEEPNFINARLPDMEKYLSITKKLDKKLTLCPYTAKYINKLLNKYIAQPCFFPFDVEFITSKLGEPTFKKSIDVLYIGHNVSTITNLFLKVSEKISMPNYLDKILALYNTKIAICHNVLFYENIIPEYNKLINEILELRNEEGENNYEVPQLKSRIFEAGFSKCIPIVYYHSSKIIETYFTPDVDFIYFKTEIELMSLIQKILLDYDSYKYIAENIYKKCIENYKVSDFVEKYFK